MPTLQEVANQIRSGELNIGSRKHYALGLAHGILQAFHCGYKKITAIEFGVGEGGGFASLCTAAHYFRQTTDIEIELYGFDLGTGLPESNGDYRDHPEVWQPGLFRMHNVPQFVSQLPPFAHYIQGNLTETVPQFMEEFSKNDSVLAFVSVDVDYYSSSKAALKVFEMEPTNYVPAVPTYFDDINFLITYSEWAGQKLALNEFNQEHTLRKFDDKERFMIENFYVCQIFDHPVRNGKMPERIPFEIHAKVEGVVHGPMFNNGLAI